MSSKKKLAVVLSFFFVLACRQDQGAFVMYEPAGPFALLGDSELNQEAPEYQCMLSRKRSNTWSNCSGSFIDENVFVTAAHCIDFEDFVVTPQRTSPYEINCFNSSGISVKSLHVHPYYYRRDTWPIVGEDLYSPNFGIRLTNSYNDLAVLITEESMSFDQYPKLPSQDFQTSNYSDFSCRSLAFSPDFCDRSTGQGCYRSGFSVALNSNAIELNCNLATGENCQIEDSIDHLSSESSLLLDFNHTDFEVGLDFTKGDSGAGILCSQNEEEYLAGVFVRLNGNEIVNLNGKLNFLNQFLLTPVEERHEISSGLEVDSDYLNIVREFHIFERLFSRLQMSLSFPESVVEILNTRAPEPSFMSVYLELKNWIEDNPEQAFNLLRARGIVSISYSALPDTILAYGTEYPNVRVNDVIGTNGFRVLEINSLSSLQEVRGFLLDSGIIYIGASPDDDLGE